MKNIFTIILSLCISIVSFSQKKVDISEKQRYLKMVTDEATVIFEGKVIKKNKAFWGAGDNANDIYTSYTVQVEKVLSGNLATGTLEIVVNGGQLEKDGMLIGSDNAHGTGLCTGSATFFCKPFTKGSSGIENSNGGDFDLVSNYCDSDLKGESGNSTTYTSKAELYHDVSQFKAISVPLEKKSPNANEIEKINEKVESSINYEQNVKNYEANFALLLEKIKNTKRKSGNTLATNDVTFSLANPTVTGTNPRYFEFDITAKANNSSTYFDGALFRLAYNTTTFGDEIVKNNKVTITRGSTFNSVTYTDPNTDKIDQTSSVIGVPLNSNFNEKSWTRTLLTTTAVQLLHFKIEIQKCGGSVDIDFEDQTFTSSFSYYTTTAGAGITDGQPYSSTTYQNPLNNIVCQIAITNFTPLVHGGLDEIIQISGVGFGDTRGNGQVKFKNANDGGQTYLSKLDNSDYVSWTDKLIKVKVPGVVDSLTPGSGDFIVKNDLGDSAITSGQIKIYYSLIQFNISGRKFHANLYNKNGLGGYTIRLDSSVTNHPDRLNCVKKAIRTWRCVATINFILGKDTIISGYNNDGITSIYFANAISGNTKALAATQRYYAACQNKDTVAIISSFDIGVGATRNFTYDTTGAVIQSGQYSFLEVITHELGHALGLQHVNDISQVMYYATQNSGLVPRTLKNYTSDTDGAIDQVSKSISTVNSQCQNFTDMIPANSSCSIATEIEALLANNFSFTTYPNPTSGNELNISFQSPKNNNSTIVIYDLFGKEVYKNNLYNGENVNTLHTVDVSKLSSGMYFISLIINRNRVSSKFIKN